MIIKTKKLSSELSLDYINEIPVLSLNHSLGRAKISLQGAQLLSWKPAFTERDILWLSEIEPFKLGVAIRGGVPICYPWFGSSQQPAHGTARLRIWQLSDYHIQVDKVQLTFSLYSDNIIEAKVVMTFTERCQISFTHLRNEMAQVALHSYFNVSNIQQIEIQNLPTKCFDKLTDNVSTVSSPRKISEAVDCIYSLEQEQTLLLDKGFKHCIQIHHKESSEIVLWNPWTNTPSAMKPLDYQKMVCIETARLSKNLKFGDTVSVEIAMQADKI